MMTVKEYAFLDPEMAVAVGLPAKRYGMLFLSDDAGNRITRVGDADFAEMLRDAPASVRAGIEIPAQKFPMSRAGWPDEW